MIHTFMVSLSHGVAFFALLERIRHPFHYLVVALVAPRSEAAVASRRKWTVPRWWSIFSAAWSSRASTCPGRTAEPSWRTACCVRSVPPRDIGISVYVPAVAGAHPLRRPGLSCSRSPPPCPPSSTCPRAGPPARSAQQRGLPRPGRCRFCPGGRPWLL